MQRWQNKIRRLRQFLRGWSKNINGEYKKRKDALLKKADELEKKAESRLLTQREIDLKQTVKDRLAHLLREEEVKWFQRAKTTKLLMGDRNTEYFHAVANDKRRKARIYRLEQNEGVIEGEDDHKRYITNYYKGLFGPSKKNNFRWMSRGQGIFLR